MTPTRDAHVELLHRPALQCLGKASDFHIVTAILSRFGERRSVNSRGS